MIPSSILTSAKEKDPRGSRCWGGCLNNEQCADPTSGAAVWTGGALWLLLVYDLIRIFRRVAAHGVVWIAVEDMFFWVISAFVLFQFLYQEDDGKVRGFVILAMFLGMLLYGRLCSRGVVKGGTFLLQRLCGGVRNYETCQNYGAPRW